MKTVTILIVATAGTMMALPIQGAELKTMSEPQGTRLETLKERLDLTPEQLDKIKPILHRQHENAVKLREDTSLSKEQKLEKVHEMARTCSEEIRPILTQEQREKFGRVSEGLKEGLQSLATEHQGGKLEAR